MISPIPPKEKKQEKKEEKKEVRTHDFQLCFDVHINKFCADLVWIYVLCLIWIFVKPKVVEVVLKIYLHCEGCAKDIKSCILKMPGLLQTYNILILDLYFLIGENLFPIAS